MKLPRLPIPLVLVATAVLGCSSTPEEGASSDQALESKDWCHTNLMATDGTEIALDYQGSGSFSRGNAFYSVARLWFNVRRPDLADGHAVRVVFLDVDDQSHQVMTTQTVDLKLAEPGRFTGEATGFGTARYHHQEVAVVIDGTWLKDPVGDKSNFIVRFVDAVTACGVTY